MKVIQYVQFFPDGEILLRWTDSDEQGPEGSDSHETMIMPDGQERYAQVGYYSNELRQDVDELLDWWLKYRRGVVQ